MGIERELPDKGDVTVCAACGEEFVSTTTKEEADAEMKELFPNVTDDEPVEVVCDDCFQRMTVGLSPTDEIVHVGTLSVQEFYAWLMQYLR